MDDGSTVSMSTRSFMSHSTGTGTASSGDDLDDIELFDPTVPFDDQTVASADSIIAKELAKLSMQDREQVLFDLHGVSDEVKETPELIREGLAKFDSALDSIRDKVAFNEALLLGAEYVLNPSFRLRFLRADRFNAKKAAERFVRHFEFKMKLFGPELLCRDVLQDDLDDKAKESLYCGSGFALPFRDRAGRLIMFQAPHEEIEDMKAVLRRMFYAGLAHSEEEETQRKGAILVACPFDNRPSWDFGAQKQTYSKAVGKLSSAIPLRVEAMHMCTNSFRWRFFFAGIKITSSLFSRLRTREHIGTYQEALFSLSTFGIPTRHFPPFPYGAAVRDCAHEQWSKRRDFERMRAAIGNAQIQNIDGTNMNAVPPVNKRIEVPGCNDVLMGRGKSSYNHVGNVRFRHIVLERSHLYEKAWFTARTRVSEEVLALIKSRGGRFLKDDDLCWVEVDDEAAVKKISHAFRTLRGLSRTGNTSGKKEGEEAKTNIKRNRSALL